jgi:pilus assembly protein Flp/PilA
MFEDVRVLQLLAFFIFVRIATRVDSSGQGLAEYGLILGLVAIVCLVAVHFLSGSIQGVLSHLGSSL